jgi:hypothetical protein
MPITIEARICPSSASKPSSSAIAGFGMLIEAARKTTPGTRALR